MAVACVANWYPNKGLLDLLDAVATLPDDDVTVHLAGRDDVDPSHTQRVRARLNAPELAGRVEVHGPLEPQGIADLYSGSDALVMPSHAETYSTVVAEALAAGLPIVAWRSTHIHQLVSDGVEGLLVSPGDVAGLASAMRTLSTDGTLRAQLADAARRRGRRLPRWSDSAGAFFAVLGGVVPGAVEPAHDRPVGGDVDAADAAVLDEAAPGDLVAHTEGPGQRRLDRADVGDDHDEAGRRNG
jgi:glycosyltransferase involved in cell wall biosynthesis